MNFTSKFIQTALALSFSKVEEVKNNRIKELLEIKLKIKEDPSVSIIDLEDNSVTNVPLAARSVPTSIAFDEAGQRVFTANGLSDSVSIIDLLSPTVARIC